jgi:nitrogen regulatory protein P-II 1
MRALKRIQVVLPRDDIGPISDGLKTLQVGGITAYRGYGRGKTIPPAIHASKGTEIFRPEFGDRFILEVIVPDNKEDDVIAIIRDNSRIGKIFVSPISRSIDLSTGREGDPVI